LTLQFGKKTLKQMEQKLCDSLFSDLYENKIIYHSKVTLLCELLNYDLADNLLTINFKVIEPLIKVKPYQRGLYEKLKQKEQVQAKARLTFNYNHIDIEKRKLTAFGSFNIWTKFELVKTICELKIDNNEQEIFDKIWE